MKKWEISQLSLGAGYYIKEVDSVDGNGRKTRGETIIETSLSEAEAKKLVSIFNHRGEGHREWKEALRDDIAGRIVGVRNGMKGAAPTTQSGYLLVIKELEHIQEVHGIGLEGE